MEPQAAKTNPITRVPLKHLKLASYNPKRRMNSEPMARLVKSIDAFGLIYPVAINEKKELIDGHRRVTACKELGWETIPTVVVKGDRDEIYADVNANAMRMSAHDNLCIYLKNQDAVTERVRAGIERFEEMLGRPTLEKICKSGWSIAMCRWAIEIARYVERADDVDFIRGVVNWFLAHQVVKRALAAKKAGLSPSTILRAITANRPLKENYAVA